MSVLGRKEVGQRIKTDGLLKNVARREIENPEGVGVDLRLGSVHKIVEGGAFINADGDKNLGSRKGVKTEQVAEFREGKKNEVVTIKPGEYYLVQTVESINTPDDLMPVVYPRSSLFRAGLNLIATKTDPGYEGPLTFGLANLSDEPVTMQLGARICNIVFFIIEGTSTTYKGQHQGGRVSPETEETQI